MGLRFDEGIKYAAEGKSLQKNGYKNLHLPKKVEIL